MKPDEVLISKVMLRATGSTIHFANNLVGGYRGWCLTHDGYGEGDEEKIRSAEDQIRECEARMVRFSITGKPNKGGAGER